MNENWPRWITASIAQHFDGYRQGVPLFVEGQYRTLRDAKEFFELRITGPDITETSRNYYYCELILNTLVQATMDSDAYKIQRYVGKILLAYVTIPIYRYGTGVNDDDTLLGCLTLKQNINAHDRIRIDYFGQVQSSTELQQATLAAEYFMHLED